ncbi:MAG: hypothetical protein DRN25_07340 [Thermoplasmata archaeon]|nr:MAG: hypothetical protein DRN25_07340 [Thermoplasmata archaeon]
MIDDEVKKNFRKMCAQLGYRVEEAPGIISCEADNGICMNLIDETGELTLVKETPYEVNIKYLSNPFEVTVDKDKAIVKAENADLIIKGGRFYLRNKKNEGKVP